MQTPHFSLSCVKGSFGLLSRWVGDNSIFLCPMADSDSNKIKSHSSSSGILYVLSWEQYPGPLSDLLRSWARVFMLTQQRARNKSSVMIEDFDSCLLDISNMYRAELEAFLMQEQDDFTTTKDNKNKNIDSINSNNCTHHTTTRGYEEYKRYLTLLSTALNIWHLFEIYFIDPSENITAQFTSWLHRYKNMSKSISSSLMENVSSIKDESDSILNLIINGRYEEAANILTDTYLQPLVDLDDGNGNKNKNKRMSDDNNNNLGDTEKIDFDLDSPIKDLVSLLLGSPILGTRCLKRVNFLSALENWRVSVMQCESHHREFLSRPENYTIHTIYKILLGQDEVMTPLCSSWLDLLVCRILHCGPDVSRDDITIQAEKCRELLNWDEDKATHFDLIAVDIISLDAPSALRRCYELLEMPWFTAHLCDLLSHSDVLDRVKIPYPGMECEWRESLILEYANTLGFSNNTKSQLWPLSAVYYEACPIYGKAYLRELVLRQDPKTDSETELLVSLCNRYKLTSEANSISLVRGYYFYSLFKSYFSLYTTDTKFPVSETPGSVKDKNDKNKKLQLEEILTGCLSWLTKSRDKVILAELCNSLLDLLVHNMIPLDILCSSLDIVSDITFTPILAFLSKYCDFLEILDLLKSKYSSTYIQTQKIKRKQKTRKSILTRSLTPSQYLSYIQDDSININHLSLCREGLEIIVRLFNVGIVPYRFQLLLLTQIIPLLNSDFYNSQSQFKFKSNKNINMNSSPLASRDVLALMIAVEKLQFNSRITKEKMVLNNTIKNLNSSESDDDFNFTKKNSIDTDTDQSALEKHYYNLVSQALIKHLANSLMTETSTSVNNDPLLINIP